MVLKATQFIQTLLFCIIAGQAFFYLIGGTAGLKNVSASTFIEQRKAIDLVIGPYLKVLYPLTIGSSVFVLVLLRQPISSMQFLLAALALLLVVVDMTIALEKNIPLNQQIQGWSTTAYPANWSVVRDQWMSYMHWRQGCSVTGLLCVLASVFGRL